MPDGRVDGDPRASVFRAQHIRREDVVVVGNLLAVELPHLHRLGAFVPQDLLRTSGDQSCSSCSDRTPPTDAYLLDGLVRGEVLLEGLRPLGVGQHDVVGDGGPRPPLGLDVRPVLCGQVEPHHQVALWNIDSFLHDAGGDQQVGFVSPELPENL